jgi:hypothetical protein
MWREAVESREGVSGQAGVDGSGPALYAPDSMAVLRVTTIGNAKRDALMLHVNLGFPARYVGALSHRVQMVSSLS